jgi:hypothetical protein
VAEAILAGTYPPDVYVAAPGGCKWLRALDVPNIAKLVLSAPTRRKADAETRPCPAPTLESEAFKRI